MKTRYIACVLSLFLLLSCLTTGCKKEAEEAPVVHGKTVADLLGEEKTLYYNGTSYTLREGVTSYLFMCTGDASEPDNSGADILVLLVLDSERKTYTLLQLDRDTVCTVDTLSPENEITGTSSMQLRLSLACGDGGEASCENAVRAVSRLLSETPIDGYMAIQAAALPLLADAVGGVTVTLTEDLSEFDPAMTPGSSVTLTGAQTETYLYCGNKENGMDPAHFQAYLSALAGGLQARSEDGLSFFTSLYETVKDYSQSDISVTALYKLLTAALGYEGCGMVTPEGTSAVLDGQTAFYADEDDLTQIVLSLFYEE